MSARDDLLTVRGILLGHGVVISHAWQSAAGDWQAVEYRVNFRGGREATAYYTNDLDDGLQTGLAMARERAKGRAGL
jgi:hypothetical protein